MQETQVQSLGQKDPLEKEMTSHPSILAWGIPWTEEPFRLQSTGSRKNRTQLSDVNHNNKLSGNTVQNFYMSKKETKGMLCALAYPSVTYAFHCPGDILRLCNRRKRNTSVLCHGGESVK